MSVNRRVDLGGSHSRGMGVSRGGWVGADGDGADGRLSRDSNGGVDGGLSAMEGITLKAAAEGGEETHARGVDILLGSPPENIPRQ